MIEQLRKDLELKNEKILSMEETIHCYTMVEN